MPLRLLLALLLLLPAVRAAVADVTYPPRPPQGTFVLDLAGLLDEGDKSSISGIAAGLEHDTGCPLIVVTIDSLSSFGASGLTIEGYARALYDTWGIGSPQRNCGMLLLVSKGDRRARIELGASWSRDHDAQARLVMDTTIVPEFRSGRYSAGLRKGAESLAKLARGERDSAQPSAAGSAGGAGPSTIRTPGAPTVSSRGGDGLAGGSRPGGGWVPNCGTFACFSPVILFFLLLNRLRGWAGYGGSWGGGGFLSGGGFSGGGGSFGGGFSGGGGASGSW